MNFYLAAYLPEGMNLVRDVVNRDGPHTVLRGSLLRYTEPQQYKEVEQEEALVLCQIKDRHTLFG
jgi:hypothetical protein